VAVFLTVGFLGCVMGAFPGAFGPGALFLWVFKKWSARKLWNRSTTIGKLPSRRSSV